MTGRPQRRSASSRLFRGRRAQEATARVLARAGGQCQMRTPGVCVGTATTLDHIVPVVLGGSVWDPANHRAACRPCNTTAGRELFRRIGIAKRIAEEKNIPSRKW